MNSVRHPISESRNWVNDKKFTTLGALFASFLIIYVAVPWDIFVPYQQKLLDIKQGFQPNVLSRILKFSFLGIGLLILLWRWSLAMQLAKRINAGFWAFVMLAFASLAWSIDPAVTLNRLISLVCIIVPCFSFCLFSWTDLRFQRLIYPTVMLLLIGSLIFGMAAPDLAIEHGEGTLKNSWKGLTGQKNQFGALSSFGVIFLTHAWLTKDGKRWISLVGALIAFTCLLLSRSSTSLLSVLLSIPFLLLMMKSPESYKRYMPYIIVIFVLTVIVFAIAVLKVVPGLDVLLTPITSFTGKDLTFSNRSEIWVIIKENAQLHPLLGSGYGAYWAGPFPSSPSYVFLSRMYFYPSESHNGYLEVVNDLGFVGLIVMLSYFYIYVRQSIKLLHINRAQGALFLSIFFQHCLLNLSESLWLCVTAQFNIVFMTYATFALARSLMDYDMRRVFGISQSHSHFQQIGPAYSSWRGRR